MIPEPAAIATYLRLVSGSGTAVNRPAGVITSSSSPTSRPPSTPSLNVPPGSFFTPTRSSPVDGAVKIEKLRRLSSPPLIERCWPATKTYSSRRCSGTSNVSATASSVRSSIAATRSEWKVRHVRGP